LQNAYLQAQQSTAQHVAALLSSDGISWGDFAAAAVVA
jgi:hypothetical protein